MMSRRTPGQVVRAGFSRGTTKTGTEQDLMPPVDRQGHVWACPTGTPTAAPNRTPPLMDQRPGVRAALLWTSLTKAQAHAGLQLS